MPAVAPAAAGNCSAATTVSCNSVVPWMNNLGNQWTTYNCLDTGLFASLPAQEALFTLAITTTGQDCGLSLPELVVGMTNAFYAAMSSCDNATCLNAGHITNLSILGDAVVQDATPGTYRLVIDSPDTNGNGRAMVACGSHSTGWCSAAISKTLTCGTFSA